MLLQVLESFRFFVYLKAHFFEFAEVFMMKNVIHIFGASGSGTTTLGKKICEELGYTQMDTDDYFWMPTEPKFTHKRPIKERVELMKNDINKSDNVVISGSLTDWGNELIPYFTLAIRIEMKQSVRIERLKKREKLVPPPCFSHSSAR